MTTPKRANRKRAKRLDARSVAKLYGVTLLVVAKAIGADPDALRKHPDSEPVQDNLTILVDCFARIYDLMARDENAVRQWLIRPNRGLDGTRPLALLETGRLADLNAIATQMETAGFA